MIRFISFVFLYNEVCLCNEGYALSLGRSKVDGSLVPPGSTAIHEPIEISKFLWGEVEDP